MFIPCHQQRYTLTSDVTASNVPHPEGPGTLLNYGGVAASQQIGCRSAALGARPAC
jgi:hypothetical protein